MEQAKPTPQAASPVRRPFNKRPPRPVWFKDEREDDRPKFARRKKRLTKYQKRLNRSGGRPQQDSQMWLEHKTILAKAGVDVDIPYWKRGRR